MTLGRRVLWCLPLLLSACALLILTGCESLQTTDAAVTADAAASTDSPEAKVDAGFLLSMTWDEAKKISAQNLVVPPFYKVAADEVTVLKQDAAGHPLKVRARGRVYMQVDFREQLTSLGQEAYIESGGELIMRGKPLLKRGRSLVEGLSDRTVFYIRGTRLQVIGSHKLTKEETGGGSDSGGAGGSGFRRSRFEVQPTWSRSWREGPNPLLPALSPDDVPKEIRMSPLLPLPDDAGFPTQLPGENAGEPKEEVRRPLGRPLEEAPKGGSDSPRPLGRPVEVKKAGV